MMLAARAPTLMLALAFAIHAEGRALASNAASVGSATLATPITAPAGGTKVSLSEGLRPAASPAAGWATTYLLNTVFAVEYAGVSAAAAKAPLTKAKPTAREQQLASAVWSRAYFALASLRAKGQTLPFATDLSASLANNPAAKASASTELVKAAESDVAVRGEPEVKSGFARLEATFNGPEWASRWRSLATAYDLPPPTCPLDYNEVKTFASRQKQHLELGSAERPDTLLAPLSGWNAAKVQCLVFALMVAPKAAQANSGFDPLPLLAALADSNSPLAHDTSLQALHATRLLQLERYPDALRLLLDLADKDDSFRLPYELVQRVFSWRQRGDGSVALQGL